MNEKSDNLLVEEILAGNDSSFKELIQKYQKPIFNLVVRMIQNFEDAKDVTQNVFIKAYENLSLYDDKYKFFSWIYRIGVNESINFRNSRKFNDEIDESNFFDLATPENKLLKMEESERINAAISNLRDDMKTLIILKHFQEFSYEEIAETMNISVSKVKSRLFTARHLLKNILVQLGEF
ncbi:MAG: sigma-70 family RNA polymerase sigma factor [Ignavibacteriales bacterium]|nr:sigma-70 family RNA polymerase sigma factor [Ignavibacteriales bacterium]